MFESALVTFLADDEKLAALIEEYGEEPAIFSDEAPEDAVMPYIVIRIVPSATDNIAVESFAVFIDFYDKDKSRVNSRKAAQRIKLILDRVSLSHARYNNIRMFYFDGSPVTEDDPRNIHYNLQFMARAGRQDFADYQTTLE
jgi:hypothetical protein